MQKNLLAGYVSPALLSGMAPDTPLLLGLSGGADSRLLLHLITHDDALHGAPIRLAHVHHGIRGADADRDEAFCRALAKEYGLPIDVLRADVPAIARATGESIETAARRVRYEYFSRLMQQYEVPLLLTAHNADDNLETVLFHLARGSGLSGLCGIAPARPFAAGMLLRPLLGCAKADIFAACRKEGLSFVTDSTNSDTTYSRNRLRAEVVPALAAIAAHPERQVTRACTSLREDEALLHTLAADFLAQNRTRNALPVAALTDAPPPIAKRALLQLASETTDAQIESVHLDALLRLCRENTGGISLPGGVTADVRRGTLSFRPTVQTATSLAYDVPLTLGERTFPEAGFRIVFRKIPTPDICPSQNEKNIYNPFIRDTLTFDTIDPYAVDDLRLRPRMPGDTLLLRGIHRKIRKLQNEIAMPEPLRTRLPLLVCGDTVLWAPFIGARDGFADRGGSYRLTVELSGSDTDNKQYNNKNDETSKEGTYYD